LRQNVSMVLQDSVLFEGTIADNIAIGKPGAPMHEIIDAAQKANIHETIIHMLGGYDRLVREQGKDLSGGQRQRMAIARAILRDAPILVLDEPTAALDVESEAEVMHALDKLVVGRTVLMISHRLSTLGSVDEIIVLKDGQIAERGSFKDLKSKGGVFAKLLEEQNRYNQDKAGEQSILRSAFVPFAVAAGYAQQAGVPYAPVTPLPPVATPRQGGGVPVTPMGQPATMRPNGNPQTPMPSQRPPAARVVIEVDGKTVGQQVLNKPAMTIGRLSSNDIQIPSQRVSRLHAKIRAANGVWIIEDAESLNGLVHQGQRIDSLALTPGMSIYMAPTVVLHYQTA
jgi:energy-coupling factor transporter ATP-binding protein EcfA2